MTSSLSPAGAKRREGRPDPRGASMTVADMIAQLQLCEPDFEVSVLEPRDERDSDGMFPVGGLVPADKEPVIFITA
jgi:hypothetical protein